MVVFSQKWEINFISFSLLGLRFESPFLGHLQLENRGRSERVAMYSDLDASQPVYWPKDGRTVWTVASMELIDAK